MIPHSSFPAFFGTHLKIAQQWILLDRIWHKIKRKKLVDGRLEYFLVVLCLLQSSIEGKRFVDCGSYGNWLGRDAVCLVPISSLLRFQRHIIRKQNGSLLKPTRLTDVWRWTGGIWNICFKMTSGHCLTPLFISLLIGNSNFVVKGKKN